MHFLAKSYEFVRVDPKLKIIPKIDCKNNAFQSGPHRGTCNNTEE